MHYHVPKPFYRKSRDTWYVEVDGRQINLGKDREPLFSGIMRSWPRLLKFVPLKYGYRRRTQAYGTLRSLS
jgi:hypothetical protein